LHDSNENIQSPYLIFLGDSRYAKTAQGVAYWRPERCLGKLQLRGCEAELELPEMTLDEAMGRGAKTLVIGVAPIGGQLEEGWIDTLVQALEAGLDIASGLHSRITEVAALREVADQCGRRLFDVRRPTGTFEVGTGQPRSGKRLLTVGTDCEVGKMYAALAIEREMRSRGMNADFRATGQTGILITGGGVSVDAVASDFVSGATEWLTPASDDDHWDLVEGQGTLFHPAYAGVTLGLLHGSQPDALVMCHDPTLTEIDGFPGYPVREPGPCIEAHLEAARLTNPAVRCVGISLRTARLDEQAALSCIKQTGAEFGLPCVDPVRTGVGPIVDLLQELF